MVRSTTHPLFVGWGPAPPSFRYREMVGQGPTLQECALFGGLINKGNLA